MKTMSDEFIRVATKEINEEIDSVAEILKSCNNNSSVIKKASLIEKHFHKIKGLAPMMGKGDIGEIAAMTDKILKHVIEGNDLNDVYEILLESNKFMKDSMEGANSNMHQLKQKIEANYANILD
jgi:chemotaxis protein histidine kinase CheA